MDVTTPLMASKGQESSQSTVPSDLASGKDPVLLASLVLGNTDGSPRLSEMPVQNNHSGAVEVPDPHARPLISNNPFDQTQTISFDEQIPLPMLFNHPRSSPT